MRIIIEASLTLSQLNLSPLPRKIHAGIRLGVQGPRLNSGPFPCTVICTLGLREAYRVHLRAKRLLPWNSTLVLRTRSCTLKVGIKYVSVAIWIHSGDFLSALPSTPSNLLVGTQNHAARAKAPPNISSITRDDVSNKLPFSHHLGPAVYTLLSARYSFRHYPSPYLPCAISSLRCLHSEVTCRHLLCWTSYSRLLLAG